MQIVPRSDGYRAFPVEDSEQNKIMQALDALAFQGRPPCETAIIVPRVGPSMTDEDIKQEWELDYLTTDITRTATRHNL